MRLNSEHHQIILDFAEINNEIITNKLIGLDAKQKNHKLWQLLAQRLDALGYGTLSVEEYKRRITDWKSKVKSKAAEENKSNNKTGGGERLNIQLNQFEQRLLSLMGHKGYKGDDINELDFKSSKNVRLSSCESTATSSTFINNTITSGLKSDQENLNEMGFKSSKKIRLSSCASTDTSSSFINNTTTSSSKSDQEVLSIIPPLDFTNKFTINSFDVKIPPLVPKKTTFMTLEKKSLRQIEELRDEPPLVEDFSELEDDLEQNCLKNVTPNDAFKSNTNQSTPSASTNRRRHVQNMSESIKVMNTETLDVLKSINQNLININNNLKEINNTLKAIETKIDK